MPEPTREDLVARIAALEKQLAAAQSGSGASVQGQDNVVSGAGGLSVGRDFIGNVYQGAPPQNDAEGVALYRRMLARSASQLPLRGVHVGASDPTSNEKQLDLDHVYVNLDTTTQFQPGEETEPKGFAPASWLQRLAAKLLPGSRRQPVEEALVTASGREREATKPLPALLATALNRRLVLLGDPGSGKSTFVNHLSLCLALHGLEPAQHWCDRLAGWPAEEADLLPVLVILRDFARTLPAKPSPADAGTLWDFITERLTKQRLGAVAKPLEDALDAGRAIVLLDGLDEIATPAHRQFLREAVLQFIERYHRSRFLVTCRTLSYQDSAWKLKFKDSAGREQDFPAFTLAPFDEPKIDQFIAAWFGDLGRLGVVKTEDAEPLTRGLQTALRRPDLWQLASNPLLLTVMALVHTHKGRLPEARALLYEDTVDILLWRWEQIKLASETETPGLRQLLVETGRSDVDLKRTLWRLAYEAHGAGGHEERLADIGELALQTVLAELHPHKDRQWAWNVIETIKHRAGLLLERLPQVYTFPHRTFQEYLAGAHLASQARFALESAKLVEAGAFWREVILLAVGKLVYLHGDTDKPLA
jgi:predicted NACHT family NTPase